MSQPDPFQALVDALRRTLTSNPPSPPSTVTSPSPAPAVTTVNTVSSPSPPVYASPMAKPAPYSGSAEDCSGFLLQCELGQSLPNMLLCRSEPVSSPEPSNEPMEVENSRLTPTERQRRLTLNLCLYCGDPGHVISACPTRPPRPMVSAIIPSIQKMKPLTTIVNLTAADISLTVVALLDSGSAGNFISGALCRQLHLKTSPSPTVYQINSITGKPLSRKQVRCVVGPIKLQVGILHLEEIHLLVLEDSTADVVLGRPWLEQHSPTISWKTSEILKWGETCFSRCFSELPIPRAPPKELSICATSIESPVEKRSIDIPNYEPQSKLGMSSCTSTTICLQICQMPMWF
ncbi:Retrotransposon-derived protein PEG10 [Anabarilius grahami]|uniref:Retrotransposon-derived protein PEG10 n=1 Tax=Anabarilius grahami TaxID=495550 RepID=A0A3N0YNG9_ANAGA|nr:Retrotransposon-derived protein PEG10 [Anabarilius grahami]